MITTTKAPIALGVMGALLCIGLAYVLWDCQTVFQTLMGATFLALTGAWSVIYIKVIIKTIAK